MTTREQNLPHDYDDALDDVLPIAKPLSALIRDHGTAFSGMVLAHWIGADGLSSDRFYRWFSLRQQPMVISTLLPLAPRISPFFEAVSTDLEVLGGGAWLIDAIFDESIEADFHAEGLREFCVAYTGVDDQDITSDQAVRFLGDWRHNVRRHMFGSCIDWIEL